MVMLIGILAIFLVPLTIALTVAICSALIAFVGSCIAVCFKTIKYILLGVLYILTFPYRLLHTFKSCLPK